ncbi:MAG: GNAT family N-acetyltransferase [Planctomycetaceae bacterium]|jgi:ribosomal protein S18 acetylase RimI-like enzyme|nr:GNAT family N-acetyltransferase [Planctomycetaceae bacterium]
MLTVRSFRNEDPPRLLSLWRKSQLRGNRAKLTPLTMGVLQSQVLGIPFFDPRSIWLAFDGGDAVGFIHTCFSANELRSGFSDLGGNICFIAVDPSYSDKAVCARVLIRAGTEYLRGRNVKEIFGGSLRPSPCPSFYTGFYGGGEAIGFFDSDIHIVQGFLDSGYISCANTVRYALKLSGYTPPITVNTVGWRQNLTLMFNTAPSPANWWDACSLAHFDYIEVTAYMNSTGKPIARARVRIANPMPEDNGMDFGSRMYIEAWDAALMDIRVHPDFHKSGVGAYTLGELLRQLVAQKIVARIEAHIQEDAKGLNMLLLAMKWEKIDAGKIYHKSFN